jgi:hypothetical protein
MSLKQFVQKDNIKMLWDVISDEDIFRFLTYDIQEKIYQLFMNNINGFFELERTKTNSLVELNKKYIIIILNHIRKTYPHQPSKIKIHNEQPIKETITYEEIQNDRRSQFDKELTKVQEEFEDFMTIKAPPVPEFADKQTDRPIKEMDKILKEMQAQRNYEVEEINKRHTSSSNNVDNWLKPQETSLKNEKNGSTDNKKEQLENFRRFKFLNDFESELSPNNSKKNVSFSNNDEINTFNEEDEEDDNIFLKLKKVKANENIKLEIQDNIIDNKIIDNKIIENKKSDDRISDLEKNIILLNEKMDKILSFLIKTN